MKLKADGFKHEEANLPILYRKVLSQLLQHSIAGKLSVKSFYLILSWHFHFTKNESRLLLQELKMLKLLNLNSNKTIVLNFKPEVLLFSKQV